MMADHPGPENIGGILGALKEMECVSKETVVSAMTSSWLMTNLTNQEKLFIALPEQQGCVQLLCVLWRIILRFFHCKARVSQSLVAGICCKQVCYVCGEDVFFFTLYITVVDLVQHAKILSA